MTTATLTTSGNCFPSLNVIEQIHKQLNAATDWVNASDRHYASIMIQGVRNGQEFQHLLSWTAAEIPGELITFFQSLGDRMYSQKLLCNPDGSLVIIPQTANNE